MKDTIVNIASPYSPTPFYYAYTLKVNYEYTVTGTTYSSDTIRFNRVPEIPADLASRALQDYAPGTTVTVYYNPDDPAEAVLQPGFQGLGFTSAALVLGTSLVLIGLFSIVTVL